MYLDRTDSDTAEKELHARPDWRPGEFTETAYGAQESHTTHKSLGRVPTPRQFSTSCMCWNLRRSHQLAGGSGGWNLGRPPHSSCHCRLSMVAIDITISFCSFHCHHWGQALHPWPCYEVWIWARRSPWVCSPNPGLLDMVCVRCFMAMFMHVLVSFVLVVKRDHVK